ncbi:MAG: DUF2207 family protein [Candidatus Cryptobacteroides sp.]
MRLLAALSCAFLLFLGTGLCAQSVVDSLRIDVLLQDDGSALVTERWDVDVRGDITEWYLVEGNLGKMQILDLQVCDETGTQYICEGEDWDVDRSRSAKAGRCGMVLKRDGCEICWGVGSEGRHSYEVSYVLTGLVKAYSDADGFNYMFVSRGHSSPPRSVSLLIRKSGLQFSEANTSVWGFGFKGRIGFSDGAVTASSDEAFTSRSGLVALVRFEKGIFSPLLSGDGSFEELRQTAMEGSDYHRDNIDNLFLTIFGCLFPLLILFLAVRRIVRKRRRKKELLGCSSSKKVAWYRDVPAGGDLKKALAIFNTFEPSSKAKERLIGAYLARLYYKGAISVVPQAKGKPAFKINEYPSTEESLSDDLDLEKRLFGFLKAAAGEDTVLQRKELRRWTESHGDELAAWQDSAPDSLSLWKMEADEVRQVFGLRNFLRDFTLIGDRGVVEVKLWNDYLIFATLFGIADQVFKDFKKVCPEYFELAREQLGDDLLTDVIIWDTINNSSRWMHANAVNHSAALTGGSARWNGGGGFTSFGGGGGFSGGGFGGGGR